MSAQTYRPQTASGPETAAPQVGRPPGSRSNAALLERMRQDQQTDPPAPDTPGPITTNGGSWSTDYYERYEVETDQGTSLGCRIRVRFSPNGLVDASKILLVQTCRGMESTSAETTATPYFLGDEERERRANTAEEGDEGRHVDSGGGDTHPGYGHETHSADETLADAGNDGIANKQVGHSLTSGGVDQLDAWLHDGPKATWTQGTELRMTFETTALATEGTQTGVYYGSVSWGCTVKRDGGIVLDPFEVVSAGVPTGQFMTAAGHWNNDQATVSGEDNPDGDQAAVLETLDVPLSDVATGDVGELADDTARTDRRGVLATAAAATTDPTDLANLRFEALAVAQGLADKSALAPEEKQALIGALRVEYTGVSAQHVALQHARNAAVDGRPDGIEDAVWTAQLKAEFDDPVQALEDVMQVLRDQVAELRA